MDKIMWKITDLVSEPLLSISDLYTTYSYILSSKFRWLKKSVSTYFDPIRMSDQESQTLNRRKESEDFGYCDRV